MTLRETDKTWEFRQRPGAFLAVGVLVLLLGLVSLPIPFVILPYLVANPDLIDWKNATVAVVFFAGGALMVFTGFSALRRVFWGNAVVMRIDPTGLWHRLSTKKQVIDWSQISDVGVMRFYFSRVTWVRVDRTAYKTIYSSYTSRVLNSVNWLFLGPVLALSVGGLDARPRQIHKLLKSYAAAYGGLRQNV